MRVLLKCVPGGDLTGSRCGPIIRTIARNPSVRPSRPCEPSESGRGYSESRGIGCQPVQNIEQAALFWTGWQRVLRFGRRVLNVKTSLALPDAIPQTRANLKDAC